jgi:hypothetical protein
MKEALVESEAAKKTKETAPKDDAIQTMKRLTLNH